MTKKCKNIKRNLNNDLVYLTHCSDCGGLVEINVNDDFTLMTAMQSDDLVVMSKDDLKRIKRSEDHAECVNC